MQKPPRIQISPEVIQRTMALFRERLNLALAKHGKGACWSTHEAVGLVNEEFIEMSEASHENDIPNFKLEAIDVMIAGFYGAASVEAGVIDGKWDSAATFDFTIIESGLACGGSDISGKPMFGSNRSDCISLAKTLHSEKPDCRIRLILKGPETEDVWSFLDRNHYDILWSNTFVA